jgi:hypothetical protein
MTKGLFALGMHSMFLHYTIAIGVAYGAFLLGCGCRHGYSRAWSQCFCPKPIRLARYSAWYGRYCPAVFEFIFAYPGV